jgi:hypothetical protein
LTLNSSSCFAEPARTISHAAAPTQITLID